MRDWSEVKRVSGQTVMGLDISTQSFAFAIFDEDKPLRCGEIFLKGADEYERAQDARRKTQSLVACGILKADYIAIERAVFVNNMAVALKLATVFGAVVGSLDGKVHGFTPLEWQNGIGNPSFKRAEKEALKKEFADKSDSWRKNHMREIRKARTLVFARQFFPVNTGSDNVGDAVGLAYFCKEEKVTNEG